MPDDTSMNDTRRLTMGVITDELTHLYLFVYPDEVDNLLRDGTLALARSSISLTNRLEFAAFNAKLTNGIRLNGFVTASVGGSKASIGIPSMDRFDSFVIVAIDTRFLDPTKLTDVTESCPSPPYPKGMKSLEYAGAIPPESIVTTTEMSLDDPRIPDMP